MENQKQYFKELERLFEECPFSALFTALLKTCSFKTPVGKHRQHLILKYILKML